MPVPHVHVQVLKCVWNSANLPVAKLAIIGAEGVPKVAWCLAPGWARLASTCVGQRLAFSSCKKRLSPTFGQCRGQAGIGAAACFLKVVEVREQFLREQRSTPSRDGAWEFSLQAPPALLVRSSTRHNTPPR